MENISLKLLEEYVYKNVKMVDGFNNIPKIRIDYLLNLSNKFRSNNLSSDNKLNYIKTLVELNKPKYRVVHKEYLEKYNLNFCSNEEFFFFLINALDPNCEIYEYYLQNYNPNIKNNIINKYGFYNKDFLYLEKKYISTLLNKFIFNIKKDYSNILLLLCSYNINFDIEQERINKIIELSNNWKNIQSYNNKFEYANSCIFNSINHKEFLGLKDETELILFNIFSIDPSFKLLQIYEDECNVKRIEQRSKEEVGIYLRNIIDIEKLLLNTNKVSIDINNWEEQDIKEKRLH